MRRLDFADDEAERLMDLVRNGMGDYELTDAIADALRAAKGVSRPPSVRCSCVKMGTGFNIDRDCPMHGSNGDDAKQRGRGRTRSHCRTSTAATSS